MKKVVLFSAFVSPYRSGAEACAEEVAARLKDRYDITIVAARLRSDLPVDDVLPTGVKVRRVGFGSSIDKWLYPVFAPSAAAALRPDIIHAVLESFAGAALMFTRGLLPNAKRILTCQSTNTSLLVRSMHGAADAVTAISSTLVKRARDFGYMARLIPNGIRSKELLEASMERVSGRILFVGRLEPMKGVDDLISAFKVVHEQHPAATLRIVGDGSERGRLERIATESGVAGSVTFVGKVAHDRIVEEYASAEIFCGLSTSEAFGNVFIEAQAAGCAVVATRVGGIPDIVHDGETGLLVAVDDAKAASDAITRLLAGSDRQAMAAAGQSLVEAYSWLSIAEKYASVWNGR